MADPESPVLVVSEIIAIYLTNILEEEIALAFCILRFYDYNPAGKSCRRIEAARSTG
jgi:hypothetical protein